MEEALDKDQNESQPAKVTKLQTLNSIITGDIPEKPDPETEKQNLVKREIIDKNYDKDLFFDFCSTRKTYGDDIKNWTYNELSDVIKEFVKYQEEKKAIEQEKNQKLLQEKMRNEEIQRNIEKIRMNSDHKVYAKEIICKKLDKTVLNDKPITCTIKNPKTTETGFFQSNYITYEIVTLEPEWSVRRRYSDFEWLRNVLVKFYPRLYVPPIPNKKIGSRRFEIDFVEKRMLFLQKFINSILQSETFKASEPLICFLSLNDRAQFEYKMKELTSIIPSLYVEDIRTLSGKLQIVDDENNEKYYVNINNYFRLQYQLLERLNYNLKQYYFNTAAACMTLENVQRDFETLHLLNSRVMMKEEVTKSFEELGIFFKNWKRIQFNQNEIIKNRIKDFFKYIKMEGSAYEELIHSREEIKTKYAFENAKLINKKEKLWASMDLSKWEISEDYDKVDRVLLTRDKVYAFAKMCGSESQAVESLHKQLGYANKNNIEELKKMINRNCSNFIKNLQIFTEELSPTLNDSLNVWTDVATFVDSKSGVLK